MLTGHLYLSCISPSSLHPFLSLPPILSPCADGSHPPSLPTPAPLVPRPATSSPLCSAFALAAAALRLRTRRRAPPPHSPWHPAPILAAAPGLRASRGAPPPSSPPRPASALAAAPLHHPCRGAPPPSLPRRPPWCAAARGFRRRQGQPAAGQGDQQEDAVPVRTAARPREPRAGPAARGGGRERRHAVAQPFPAVQHGNGPGKGCGARGAHLGSIPAISWGGGWPEGGRRWWGRSSGQPLMAAGGEKFDSGLGKLERGSRSEGGGSGGGGAATHQRNQTAAVGDGRSGRFQHLCSSSGTRVWRKKKEWRLVSVPHQR